MGNYKSISGLNYFRDKIKNFLSNTIWIPPLSFRINTVAYKKANNIKNKEKVDSREVFDNSNITFEYLIDLKNEVKTLIDKIDFNKFIEFKKNTKRKNILKIVFYQKLII